MPIHWYHLGIAGQGRAKGNFSGPPVSGPGQANPLHGPDPDAFRQINI